MWDFLGGLDDWAAQLGADIIAFVSWLASTIVAVFVYLYSLIAAVFQFLWNGLKVIADALHTVWDQIYNKVLLPIWHAIQAVHAWLESVLSPIISVIKKIRDFLNRWFLAYIKPILKVIGTIRKFLEILRAFGVQWAGTLDKLLGKIQNDITKTFQKVQSYLNNVINLLNALADPLGLFRRPTLVMSMRRIFPSALHTITGLPLGYFFPTPRKNPAPGLGPTPFPFNASDPSHNPVASSYFNGDDGLGDFGGYDVTETPADDSIDGTTPLDFFNADAYPDPPYSDATDGMQNLVDQITSSSFVQV